VLRHTFTGTTGDEVYLPSTRAGGDYLLAERVAIVEDAGVVEVMLDPLLDDFEFSEIHDEPVRIRLVTAERQREGPVVPVDEGAMPVVVMLPMCEGHVGVGFPARNHVESFHPE
jgi:hypothetical protein